MFLGYLPILRLAKKISKKQLYQVLQKMDVEYYSCNSLTVGCNTILNPRSCASSVSKYSHHHDQLESKMSSIEGSLSNGNATTGRRRKGSSLSGAVSSRGGRGEAKELRSALQDREAVIQNLRIQLCLGKLPRPSGPPLDDSEKPAAEQKLQKLKAEAENKRIKIKNLKGALEKLDITDNIDVRIRQAELEYALGREELQMLSVVEEARALQSRLEKSKPEPQTLYSVLSTGNALSLHAVQATTGRWAGQTRSNQPGCYIDWALEGDGLFKDDRIIEINGKLVNCRSRDELQMMVGSSGKCEMVVLRRKPAPQIQHKQLDKEKENNLRLQHRISYLEEQVQELQTTKEQQLQQKRLQHQQHQQHQQQQQHQQHQQQQLLQAKNVAANTNGNNSHVTSISISSPPTTPPEKPLIYQRGNYITTLVGGKPIELLGEGPDQTTPNHGLSKSNSAAHITKTLIKEHSQHDLLEREHSHDYMAPKSLSASKISIHSDSGAMHQHYKREKERQRERYERSVSKTNLLQQRASREQARSVEHLNQFNCLERRRDSARGSETHTLRSSNRLPIDMRSVKSLDFDSESESSKPSSDTRSEVRAVRPTPPKKPLRLSLQRAQSLQTVELNPSTELDRKRPLKRAHINERVSLGEGISHIIENLSPLQTASLGRPKNNI